MNDDNGYINDDNGYIDDDDIEWSFLGDEVAIL